MRIMADSHDDVGPPAAPARMGQQAPPVNTATSPPMPQTLQQQLNAALGAQAGPSSSPSSMCAAILGDVAQFAASSEKVRHDATSALTKSRDSLGTGHAPEQQPIQHSRNSLHHGLELTADAGMGPSQGEQPQQSVQAVAGSSSTVHPLHPSLLPVMTDERQHVGSAGTPCSRHRAACMDSKALVRPATALAARDPLRYTSHASMLHEHGHLPSPMHGHSQHARARGHGHAIKHTPAPRELPDQALQYGHAPMQYSWDRGMAHADAHGNASRAQMLPTAGMQYKRPRDVISSMEHGAADEIAEVYTKHLHAAKRTMLHQDVEEGERAPGSSNHGPAMQHAASMQYKHVLHVKAEPEAHADIGMEAAAGMQQQQQQDADGGAGRPLPGSCGDLAGTAVQPCSTSPESSLGSGSTSMGHPLRMYAADHVLPPSPDVNQGDAGGQAALQRMQQLQVQAQDLQGAYAHSRRQLDAMQASDASKPATSMQHAPDASHQPAGQTSHQPEHSNRQHTSRDRAPGMHSQMQSLMQSHTQSPVQPPATSRRFPMHMHMHMHAPSSHHHPSHTATHPKLEADDPRVWPSIGPYTLSQAMGGRDGCTDAQREQHPQQQRHQQRESSRGAPSTAIAQLPISLPVPLFQGTKASNRSWCGWCGVSSTFGCWRKGWRVELRGEEARRAARAGGGAYINLCNRCGLRYNRIMQQQQPNEDTGYMPDQDSAVQASQPLTPVQFMGHAAAHHAGPPQMSQTSVLHHVGVPKQALSAPGSAPTGVLATSFSSKLSPSLLQINATSQQDVYSNAVQGRSQGTFISHPAGMAHHAKSGTTTSRQLGAARANGQEAGPVGIFSTRAAMLPLPKPTTASQESVPHSVPARLPAMMPYPAEVEVPIDPEALEREYQRVPKFGAAELHADALMGHAAGMGLAPEQPERNLLFFTQQLQQLRSHAQEIGIASQPLAAALTARAAPPVQSAPPMHAAVDLPAHKHATSMGLAMGDVHARHLANAHAPAGPATTHASAHGPERIVPPGVSAATAVKAAAVSAAASRASAWGCMEPPQEVQDALHAAGLALTDVDYRTMADLESSDAETAVSTALKDACLATAAAAAYERTCTARPSINSSHTRAPNRSLAAGHMPTAAGGQAQQQQHVKMEQGQQQQDQQQFLHVLQSRLKDMWRRKPPAPTQSKLHASVAPPMANPASAAADPRWQAYPAADAEPHAHAHAACLVDHSVHCTAGMSLPGDNAPAEHSYGHAGGAAVAASMHHGQHEPAAAEALGDAAESSVKQQEQRQHVHHRQYASIHSAGDTGRVAGLRVRAPAAHELASSMYESSLEALGQAAHAWAARNAQRKGLTLAALQHDVGIPVHAAHAAAHPPAYLAAPHSPAGKATLHEHVLQQQTPAPAPYAQALRPSLLSHSADTPSIVYGPQAADLTAVGRLSSGSAAQAHTHARQPAQHKKHASQSHAMQSPCAAEAEAHPGIKQVDSMSELSQDCADVALALLSLQRGEQARVDTTPSAHAHDSTADASFTRQHREQDHQAGYDQAQNASHSLHRARASMASHPTTAITWPHHGITLPPAPPLIMPQLDYPSPTATPPPLRSMPSIPTPVSPPLLLPPGLSAVGLAAAPEQQVYAPVAGHSAITQHLLAKEGSSLQFGMLPQPQLQRPSANMLPRQEAMQASASQLHLPRPLQLAGGLAKALQTANNASGVSSTHDGLALPGLDSAVLGMLGASNKTQPLSHATSAGQTVIQLPVGHHMEVMNAALQGHASCQPVLLQPALLQPALLSPTYTSPGARAAASAGGAGQPTGAVAGNAIAEGTACTARASQAAAPEQCHSPSLSQHPAQDRASPSLQGLASGPLQGSAAEEECDTHQDYNCPPSSELSKETLSVLARIAKLQPAALASTLRAEFPTMAMYARLTLMEQLLTQAGAVSSKASASPIKAGENESV